MSEVHTNPRCIHFPCTCVKEPKPPTEPAPLIPNKEGEKDGNKTG